MKILFIIDSLRRGGKERQLAELAINLIIKNHTVSIIVFDNDIQYKELYDKDIKVFTLNKKKFAIVKSVFRLFSIIKKQKPDLIHSWSSLTTLMVYPAAKINNIKLIDSIRYAKSIKLFSQKWLISNLAFMVSSLVIANSNAGLKTHDRGSGKKYKVIHNGYRSPNPGQLLEENKIKTKLGIKQKYVVGMVATFHPGKDYSSFIQAAIAIIEKRDDVCFMCIGDGVDKIKLENSIEEKYRPFIKFTGKRNDVELLIEIFDIGVLLSNIHISAEGISNALTEIMAAGKPVVATNAGGNKELISDEKDGFLIDAFASNQLVDKILLLIKNDNKRIEIGQQARDKVAIQFSIEKMVNNYLNAYQQLVK